MLGESGSFNQQINGLTPNENEYAPYFLLTESALWSAQMKRSAAGSVSDLLVFISGLARFNEVKSLNVRLRILGVIKMHFCKFISTPK